jgi:hypothetical protein
LHLKQTVWRVLSPCDASPSTLPGATLGQTLRRHGCWPARTRHRPRASRPHGGRSSTWKRFPFCQGVSVLQRGFQFVKGFPYCKGVSVLQRGFPYCKGGFVLQRGFRIAKGVSFCVTKLHQPPIRTAACSERKRLPSETYLTPKRNVFDS